MTFYYIRHGEPIYNPDSLTELGHRQADALSKYFLQLSKFCAYERKKKLDREMKKICPFFIHFSKKW